MFALRQQFYNCCRNTIRPNSFAEICRKCQRIRVAEFRVFSRRLLDDPIDFRLQSRFQARDLGQWIIDMFVQSLDSRNIIERMMSRNNLEYRYAQAIDIGSGCHWFATRLFRRDVIERPDDDILLGVSAG